MAEKLDRKQLKRPDEFQLVAGQAMEWLVAHQRVVMLIGGAVVVAALLAWGAAAYKSSVETRAGAALSEALELQSRPIAGDAQAQPGAETFPSKDEREKATLAALEKVRAEHGGSTAAQTAQAEIGFRKLKSGDAAGAQKELQEFLDKSGKDHPLRAFALESLGYAYEAQGKLDDARGSFEKLREAGMPARADFQVARLMLVQNKPEAKKALEDVAKNNSKDPVSMEANQRLELAALPPYTAPAVAPAPAPEKAIPAKPAPGKPAPKPAAAKGKAGK